MAPRSCRRVYLDLNVKIKVLHFHDDGTSARKLALKFNCSKNQVNNIIKNKDNLLKEYEDFKNLGIKRARNEKFGDVNEAVIEWFRCARSKNLPLSIALVKEKAIQIAKSLGVKNFCASNGWLDRFCIRNNIAFKTLCRKSTERTIDEPDTDRPSISINPDDEPSISDTSSKDTDSTKILTTPETDETSEKKDNNGQVWTSLLNLHPITSAASSSGLSEPTTANQNAIKKAVAKPKKMSTKKYSSGDSKPKSISILRKKRARSPSPAANVPVENKEGEMMPNLCIVKMEIEEDGYTNNEEENFIASLTSNSSQKTQNNTLDISSSISIKTEPCEVILPTISNIVTTVKESAEPLLNGNEHVEMFFKSIVETVVQLPPHLIEETKTKVSSLVYDMVIRAIGEGFTNIKQPKE